MKEPYMFLIVIIPNPRNLKQKLDVYLQPFIIESNFFSEHSVETYNVSRK